MKVNVPNHNIELQNENVRMQGSQNNYSKKVAETSPFLVDISSNDKGSFGLANGGLETFDDIKSKAATKNVSLEHNALAVMSNTMTGEDFEKAMEDGFSPADMSVEKTVTVVDKIKATLASSGVEIQGYTDNLSSAEIEKIAGSKSYAAAIESAIKENQIPATKENVKSITDVLKQSETTFEPNDDAKKYMVSNDILPTVNNIYMANHSAVGNGANNKASYYMDEVGYVSKNPTNNDVEELMPQIEKIITESGLDASDEMIANAKWLIEKNIPLTKENLENLNDINSLQFPLLTKVVADSSAASIADGYSAKDGVLTNTKSVTNRVAEFVEKVNAQVENVASDISKRRLVEEIRLHLTMEASNALLKKGIEIDTSDLQNLVDELKQAEKEAYAPFLMDKNYDEAAKDFSKDELKLYDDELTLKLDLFKQTTKSVEDIKSAPVELIGELATLSNSANVTEASTRADDALNSNTLDSIAKRANTLKADYDRAGKSYETMMTAPRADMGDSIKKAFRNVDDILEDMNLEVTRLNEKAVRILGYSGMEINEENIENAIKAEVAVENVITNMTPAKVLKMIRDGENPLEKDIYELSEKITNQDFEKDDVRYSEFLFKLEHAGEITEPEKTAFIGMFRMIKKIEKSDGKLVGDVLKADEKLTFENLISASRTDRHIGTDVKIDDSFGALEKLVSYGESITDQILAGFSDKEKNAEYAKAQATEIKEMVTKEEAVLRALENIEEPQSPVNMSAMNALINMRGSLFRGLKDSLDDDDKSELEKDFEEIRESFTDEETVKDAYKSFAEKTENLLKNKVSNADKYIDVNSLKLMNKQLSIVNSMVNQKTYEVPVEIDGKITSINLKFVSDADHAGKVTASFETEETGKVSAEFTLRNGEVTGYIVTENTYYENIVKGQEDTYRTEFSNAGVDITSMYFTSKKGLSIKGNYTESNDSSNASSKQLYSVAKAIIKAVQK